MQRRIEDRKKKTKTANNEAERKKLIAAFYNIIRNGAELKVFNESLQKDICVTNKSAKETKTHAARFTTSTNAVFELLSILKNAKKIEELPIKANSKSQKVYRKMIVLTDNIKGIGEVKLTVGVLKDGDKHIQYCLTALE